MSWTVDQDPSFLRILMIDRSINRVRCPTGVTRDLQEAQGVPRSVPMKAIDPLLVSKPTMTAFDAGKEHDHKLMH